MAKTKKNKKLKKKSFKMSNAFIYNQLIGDEYRKEMIQQHRRFMRKWIREQKKQKEYKAEMKRMFGY